MAFNAPPVSPTQGLLILSLRFESAGSASVLRCTLDILLAFALEAAAFGQTPGAAQAMGAALVVATVGFEGYRRKKQEEEEEEEQEEKRQLLR